MARDIIDHRLLGALHLQAMDRAAFDHDPDAEHVAFQVGTLDALMDGHFDGCATIGEVLAHGDHGLGTVEHLAGELVVVDGEAFVVDGDGVVTAVPAETTTPFAVVCRFSPVARTDVTAPLDHVGFIGLVEGLAAGSSSILAYRAEGEFVDLLLRSVHAQVPPYPPLAEVTAHQTEWTVPSATGTVIGFRFPDVIAGVEVPGHHAHFLSTDRKVGGHVLGLTMGQGHLAVDAGDDLHVELPEHIGLGVPGAADRAAIRGVEGPAGASAD